MPDENVKNKIIENLNKYLLIHQSGYIDPCNNNKIIIDFLINKIIDLQYRINELKESKND